MPYRLKMQILVLLTGALLVLSSLSVLANPLPGPVWDELKADKGYGHVMYSLEPDTRTYQFTVFNDSSKYYISAFTVYPETRMYGVVPVQPLTAPAGWEPTEWEGPDFTVTSSFGELRTGFTSTSSFSGTKIAPNTSQDGFAFRWVTSQLPTKLGFGVQLTDSRSNSFWAQVPGEDVSLPPSPVPDAGTLVLFGSGGLLALVWQRRSRRECSAGGRT